MEAVRATFSQVSAALGRTRRAFEVGAAEKGGPDASADHWPSDSAVSAWRIGSAVFLGAVGVATVTWVAVAAATRGHAAGPTPPAPGPGPLSGGLALGLACRTPGGGESWRLGLFDAYGAMPDRCDAATLQAMPDLSATFFGDGKLFAYEADDDRIGRYGIDAQGRPAREAELTLGITPRGLSRPSVHSLYVNASLVVSLGNPQTSQGNNLVTWDPGRMAVVARASAASLYIDDPYHAIAELGAPVRFGDLAVWPLSRTNAERSKIVRDTSVVTLDLAAFAAPTRVVRDTRCIGATSAFVDSAGDLYVTANANAGWYLRSGEYNPASKQLSACVLRMRRGTTTFDTNFVIDLSAALGTSGIWATAPVTGDVMGGLALANLDLRARTPALTREQWLAEGRYVWRGVDTAGRALPGGGAAPAAPVNASASHFAVDDEQLVQMREAAGEQSTAALYAVDPAGILHPRLRLSGDATVVALGRLKSQGT